MFYNDRRFAFLIQGVYRETRRAEKTVFNTHDFASVSFRLSGRCVFTAFGERVEASGDCAAYLPPNTEISKEGEPEELIFLHLRLFGEYPSTVGAVVCPEARGLFERMEQTWREKLPGYENRTQALLYEAFAAMERTSPIHARRGEIIKDGLAYLRKHFTDPGLRVSDAAAACHVSEVYFRRLCREAVGMTPVAYIAALRVDYAMRLLRTDGLSVARTAELAGFGDVKYFSDVFHKIAGCTPSACRNSRA